MLYDTQLDVDLDLAQACRGNVGSLPAPPSGSLRPSSPLFSFTYFLFWLCWAVSSLHPSGFLLLWTWALGLLVAQGLS